MPTSVDPGTVQGRATSFQAQWDALPVAVMVVDHSGTISYANTQADLLFAAKGRLTGSHIDSLVPQPERRSHARLRADFQQNPSTRPMGRRRHLRGLRVDGSSFQVEVALAPAPLGIDGTLAVVRDVTERVQTEERERITYASAVMAAERMRIARDLHDQVIQELFAAGLILSGSIGDVTEEAQDTMQRVIDVIDDSIRRLRGAIFQLHAGEDADLEPIVEEANHVLGFRPTLTVRGDLTSLDQSLRSDVMSVVRETLSNIARHSSAASASVLVEVADHHVTITVTDDGVGMSSGSDRTGTGLRSLEERAAHHRGGVRFESNPGGGTIVVWIARRR